MTILTFAKVPVTYGTGLGWSEVESQEVKQALDAIGSSQEQIVLQLTRLVDRQESQDRRLKELEALIASKDTELRPNTGDPYRNCVIIASNMMQKAQSIREAADAMQQLGLEFSGELSRLTNDENEG